MFDWYVFGIPVIPPNPFGVWKPRLRTFPNGSLSGNFQASYSIGSIGNDLDDSSEMKGDETRVKE